MTSIICVIIGVINVLLYTFLAYASIMHFDNFDMIFHLPMVILSILLIGGIIKKRASLMLPWIVLTTVGTIPFCIKLLYHHYKSFENPEVPVELWGILLGVVLSLFPVIYLHNKLRKEKTYRAVGPQT